MLIARVSPPLPDLELPRQLPIQQAAGKQRVLEIITRPGGLLVRRLAADLAEMGRELAWLRPLPFEPDATSLGPLLLTALGAARRSSSGGKEPVVVIESPTVTQAHYLMTQLLAPGTGGIFAPTVVLIMNARRETYVSGADGVILEVPSWSPRAPLGLPAERGRSAIPLRQLCMAAGGLADLINSVACMVPQPGRAELARIVARSREPSALTHALASRILSGVSAERLAALEMAGHLGYAHARFGSLEPAVAGSAAEPWWIPLSAGWLQMNLAWRKALLAGAGQAPGAERLACLSRLVADLADEGATHEAIELCVNAGWHGLAADLLTEEAQRLVSSGRQAALGCWLDRLPMDEIRSHPRLAALAREREQAQGDPPGSARRVLLTQAAPSAPRRRWSFGRPRPGLTELAGPSPAPGASRDRAPPTAPMPAGEASGAGVRAATGDPGRRIRVEACLLGLFELRVDGQPVRQWRGNRGRMLLAYLLLHRVRPVHRDALADVFWSEAAPDVVRNRLHVALYGLRRDLREASQHPIVIHGRGGFCLHPDVDLWLDTEAFAAAICAARTEEGSRTEVALSGYETALQLYRGDLLQDAPFEEWALLDREQLRMQYLEALDRIAVLRFELGRYADCIPVCQRLVAGDPCREDVHRLLMRCYVRLNQPHLAVHQYHQCERHLRDELGLGPADATRELHERIRHRQLV
jgi:DNA-binding SARP family transcriptional activator